MRTSQERRAGTPKTQQQKRKLILAFTLLLLCWVSSPFSIQQSTTMPPEPSAAKSKPSNKGRYCVDCNKWCDPDKFSNEQWREGAGISRCVDCDCEKRSCAECQCIFTPNKFSSNQWLKGEGYSRCYDCVNRTFECNECGREFSSRNNLEMHAQVHRPRDAACPVCGERRFRSSTNAVRHVERGYCSKCHDIDDARDQIYRFASGKSQMHRFMTNNPLLTDPSNDSSGVPNLPYHCPDCNESFHQLSQFLQHQDSKHNNSHFLTD
jgi:DNA-directed RNA polymerase subunit RPC12/RpoP